VEGKIKVLGVVILKKMVWVRYIFTKNGRWYMRGYMYVPCRIRGGTCMYPAVYEGVHVCTLTYMRGYMYVPPRIRGGTCMYARQGTLVYLLGVHMVR